ncbi:efflux RND transporter permease subunit [Candidatus Sumerlaeota bacterium]|nr:efflux RND transporter permease subunit [Candidatus Sumerlaeota bacterium]
MSIAHFSIHRPIFTIMVTLIVIILGGVSLYRLPIDLMPDITYPSLSVSTSYENASPEEIEQLITRPIEEAMSAVPGVEEVTSSSAEGSSRVRLSFNWGTDLDAASADVRDRLDRVIGRLPDDADRPSLWKFDLASFPILMLGASSNMDPVQMLHLIEHQVKYRIERVPGVAALDVWGGLSREIHVDLYPDKIKALEIPINQILSRIREGNVNVPAGALYRGNYNIMVRTPGEYTDLDQLRNTVITVREGVPVKLSEIANVEDSWERVTRFIRVNGIPGIRLAVNKQSGKNTVEVARRVLDEIENINRDIPQIKIIPIMDTSDYIKRSINNLGNSAIFGGLLAVLVLMFFLRSLRSTGIIATVIPVSMIATFALIYFGGFTLNIMTLGGLALGVGMLVDNAIVVLENIYRYREEGREREESAMKGSAEVTSAIIASTLTTVVVFLPLVFMRGMAGVMFKQLSLVVSFSLLCSLISALTLVPMLAAKTFPKKMSRTSERKTLSQKLYHGTGDIFHAMELSYRNLLHFVLSHRLLVVVFLILILIGSLFLFSLIGRELMPAADEGEVRITAEMEVGTRVEVVDERFRKIEEIVKREVPEIKTTTVSVGGYGWGGISSHRGDMRISLVPQKERTRSSEDIANDLRKKLSNMPGMTIRTRAGQGLFLLRMGTGDSDRLEIEIRGYDLQTADELAQKVKRIAESVEGVTDARISRDSGNPEELIVIDRQKAADMKLTVSEIANSLQTVLSGTRAGDFREGGDEFRILVKLQDAEETEMKDILDLIIVNSAGEPVVLRNVVDVKPRKGPVRIERKDQERIITVSANISGRDMESIVKDIQKQLQSLPRPRDFSIIIAGDYEEQQKAFRELIMSFILAIILVYMVMACQFESLRDPFVVMFSVPMASIGVILMLFLTNTTFNIQSFIGCIMLGGIVVNNAILLVDHTNMLRRQEGLPLMQAIEEAGRHRLRPILMTACTTMLGLTPLAIGLGEGGEAQAPMARAVIGGLISASLITLIIIPVVYSLFERKYKKSEP